MVEINVLIILGYLIIFGVSALTTFGVTLWNGQNFRKELVSYFLCESTGTSGDKVCSRMGIEQFSTHIYSFDTTPIWIVSSSKSCLCSANPRVKTKM